MSIPGVTSFHPRSSWEDPSMRIAGGWSTPKSGGTYWAPKRSNYGQVDAQAIHYPWADVPDGDVDDLLSVASFLRLIQAVYARDRGYSFGYSWAVDWLGGVWEGRGWDLNPAANASHNGHTNPILLLVDWDGPATLEAIHSAQLIEAESIRRSGRTTHWIGGHNDLRTINGKGTATSCCGAGLYSQLKANNAPIGHGGLFLPGTSTPPTPEPPTNTYNPPSNWGLYPLDFDKPVVKWGDNNQHVRYLQDALHFAFGNKEIVRDGKYGQQTADAVIAFQKFWDITQSGQVHKDTWDFIDWGVVGFPTPPEPDPDPPSDVQSVTKGYYFVRVGDSPWAASERVYGSGSNWKKLSPTTPVSPGFNAPNHHIRLPGVPGKTTKVQPGEGAYTTISRMGKSKNSSNLNVFYDFNGGEDRTLHPGDLVFMPD